MRYLLASLMLLAPLVAVADDSAPLQLAVTYLGSGQYGFEKDTYDYKGLLQAIRAEYGAQHIASISVDMGDGSGLSDKPKVCRLKLDTGALVALTFTRDGQQNTFYCL